MYLITDMSRKKTKKEESINISITIEFTLLIPGEVSNVQCSRDSRAELGSRMEEIKREMLEKHNKYILPIMRIYFQFEYLKPNKAEMTENLVIQLQHRIYSSLFSRHSVVVFC